MARRGNERMKYTHRVKMDKEKIKDLFGFDQNLIQKYYKNGFLHGYLADGVLLGDLVEVNSEYVSFEYWMSLSEVELKKLEKC